jgi:hypothetical protein
MMSFVVDINKRNCGSSFMVIKKQEQHNNNNTHQKKEEKGEKRGAVLDEMGGLRIFYTKIGGIIKLLVLFI